MYKLNLDFYLKDLKGQEVRPDKAYFLLADALSKKSDNIAPIKAMTWALDLMKSREIKIDKSDLESLYTYIENCAKKPNEGFFNIFAVPIMDIINDVKNKKEVLEEDPA